MSTSSSINRSILARAIKESFIKLNPKLLWTNPVMLVVEVLAVLTTYFTIRDIALQSNSLGFDGQIAAWLWITVLFANFAEALAEGRGKAQAESLRKTRSDTIAKKLVGDKTEDISAAKLVKGDIVLVETGELIPGDGEIIEGIASVDESAVTGESAPVIRESGGDRSAVTGGTRVLSDWIKVKITANPGETFLDRMISLVEGAKRRKTPNEIALTIFVNRIDHHLLIGSYYVRGLCHLFRGTSFRPCAGCSTSLLDPYHDWRLAQCYWYSRNGSSVKA